MKAPKSAGKRVQWAVRFLGFNEPMSGTYADKDELCTLKRFWEKHNPDTHYELVKITTEPVTVEKKKRKAK